MKVNENEIWNGQLKTQIFDSKGELEATFKHNNFHHSLKWFDPKTTTVRQAFDFTNLDNVDNVSLMLLVKHESEEFDVLEFATGLYTETANIINPIYQFRYCKETQHYQYLPPEGEIFAFAFIDDLPLMRIFNEDE
jgi:hypothetical protein